MIKSIREYGPRRYGLYLWRKHWTNRFLVWVAMIVFGIAMLVVISY